MMNKILSLNSTISDFKILSIISFIYYIIIICDNVISAEKLAKCDFLKFERGCRNSDTQQCDQKSQQCKCRPQYPINLSNGICLEKKSIGESCMGSIQCDDIPNAGCYGLDTEFKDDFWILLWHKFGLTDPGKCNCDLRKGFSYNHSLKACVKNLIIGSHCSGGWDCYSKVPNSICSAFDRCECGSGYYYETHSDSCKLPLNYGDECVSNEGCVSSLLTCDKGICKCKSGYHFDKYNNPKCQPNNDNGCPDNYKWSEKLGNCVDKNVAILEKQYNIKRLNEFGLIEPPRIYSIFVILTLWICLLFILGNAKKGIRLVEKAVRRYHTSEYRQCDTSTTQTAIETEHQEMVNSQISLNSSMSSAINQCYPPPTFDELYPNVSSRYNDDPPPTYEELFDKQNNFVV